MTSERTVLTVIIFMGFALVELVTGLLILSYQHKTISDALIALASGLAGGIGALLVSTRSVSPPATPEETTQA